MTSSAQHTLPAAVLRLGGAGALAAFVVLLGLAPEAIPWAVPALALVLFVAVAAPAVREWELRGFVAVVVLSLSALGADDTGTDVFEVAFGVSLLAYLVAWYGKVLIGGRRFLRSWTDVAAVSFFVLGGLGGLVTALLVGTDPTFLRSDLTCVLALALYFPARELCVRSKRGPEVLAVALLFLGLMATASSAFRVYNALTGATQIYEVVDVRVSMGEIQITAGLLTGLLWTTVARKATVRIILVVIVAALLGGLILAKSRGPWITAALGVVVAGVIAPEVARRRLVPYAVGGVLAMLAVGIAVLGDRLALIGIGLLRRLTSISGAMTQDVSLLNRYAETNDALEVIARSPIFGYGWGATVDRFDLIVLGSLQAGFLHNGYVWYLHKVGLVGLIAFLGLFGGALLAGGLAARTEGASDRHRAFAAASAGILVAYAVLALPSNPFAVLDQVFVVVIVLGMASGLWERRRAGRTDAL